MVLICPTLSQPRFHKRANELAKLYDLHIFAFSRGLYEVNEFDPSYKLTNLGAVQDKKYYQRIFSLIKGVLRLRKELQKQKNCAIYFWAFSLDVLLMAYFAGLKNGVYEVADIRFDRSKKSVLTIIENFLSRIVLLIVVTSEGFISEVKRAGDSIRKKEFHLIENKLSKEVLHPLNSKVKDKIERPRVGVIGFLRYEIPLKSLLYSDAVRNGNIEVHCWGDGPFRTLFEDCGLQNVHYYGPFKNPEQLASIYDTVDMNFVVYGGDEDSEKGVQLAIPNKFFESIYFGTPIICRKNTELAKRVTSLDVGIAVSIDDLKILDGILNQRKLKMQKENCQKIEEKTLFNSDEITKISERLRKLSENA